MWTEVLLYIIVIAYAVFIMSTAVVIVLENRQPAKTIAWLIVIWLLPIIGLIFFYFFGEMFEYGSERLIWTLIKGAVALVLALAMIPLFAAARRNSLMASAQGNEELVQTRKRGQVMVACVGLGLCLYALSNGVPAVLDVADGPHTVTVTSCSFEQYKTSRSRPRGGVSTVYKNQFIMTFEDGSTHTQTVETDSKDEIARQGDVTAVLYEACARRSGSASMTMEVYPHTWSIVEARID